MIFAADAFEWPFLRSFRYCFGFRMLAYFLPGMALLHLQEYPSYHDAMSATMTGADHLRMEEFLEAVRDGQGINSSAIAHLGWSPAKLREMMRDPDFKAMVEVAELQLKESVVHSIYRMARDLRRPNLAAAQTILYCKHADEGWRPPTQRVAINQRTSVEITAVAERKQAAIELLREQGIKALQPPVAEIEQGVIDAEVVSDDDDSA